MPADRCRDWHHHERDGWRRSASGCGEHDHGDEVEAGVDGDAGGEAAGYADEDAVGDEGCCDDDGDDEQVEPEAVHVVPAQVH